MTWADTDTPFFPPIQHHSMAKKAANGITHETIIRDIQAGNIAPVYYLMGEEPYYIDRLAAFISDTVVKPEERDFNLTTVYGTEVSMTDIVQAALSFPMGEGKQVVMVKDAQKLTDLEPLAGYLRHPQPLTVLIFCHPNGTIDRRKAGVVKLLESTGVIYESAKLRDYQMPQWIRSYAKRNKAEIEPQAESMLTEYVGNNLNRMAGEIDKLLISLPQNQRKITSELVAKHIGISKEYNIFELIDAFAQKDVLKAMTILKNFDKNNKQNPIQKTLPQLFKFFQNLMLAYYAPDKTNDGIAAWIGANPYAVKQNIIPAMKHYTARKTMNIISMIRRTDARSKGVDNPSTEEGDLMKELAFYILHD